MQSKYHNYSPFGAENSSDDVRSAGMVSTDTEASDTWDREGEILGHRVKRNKNYSAPNEDGKRSKKKKPSKAERCFRG